MNIAVDLDEVLAETMDQALKVNNYQICGKKITKNDISNYFVDQIPGLNATLQDCANFFDKLRLDDEKHNVKAVKGALEVLKKVKQDGKKIYIITARRESNKEYTQERIEKHYPAIFENIIYTNHLSDNETKKSDMCQKHNIKIMVEDNLDYAIDMANTGVQVFLLDKPRNQHYDQNEHKGIKKIYSREEFKI